MALKLKAKKRSDAFIPDLVTALTARDKFTCKFSDLPKSYQDQPYNLPQKLLKRGGIEARIVVNKEHDTFSVIRFGIKPMPQPKKRK